MATNSSKQYVSCIDKYIIYDDSFQIYSWVACLNYKDDYYFFPGVHDAQDEDWPTRFRKLHVNLISILKIWNTMVISSNTHSHSVDILNATTSRTGDNVYKANISSFKDLRNNMEYLISDHNQFGWSGLVNMVYGNIWATILNGLDGSNSSGLNTTTTSTLDHMKNYNGAVYTVKNINIPVVQLHLGLDLSRYIPKTFNDYIYIYIWKASSRFDNTSRPSSISADFGMDSTYYPYSTIEIDANSMSSNDFKNSLYEIDIYANPNYTYYSHTDEELSYINNEDNELVSLNIPSYNHYWGVGISTELCTTQTQYNAIIPIRSPVVNPYVTSDNTYRYEWEDMMVITSSPINIVIHNYSKYNFSYFYGSNIPRGNISSGATHTDSLNETQNWIFGVECSIKVVGPLVDSSTGGIHYLANDGRFSTITASQNYAGNTVNIYVSNYSFLLSSR